MIFQVPLLPGPIFNLLLNILRMEWNKIACNEKSTNGQWNDERIRRKEKHKFFRSVVIIIIIYSLCVHVNSNRWLTRDNKSASFLNPPRAHLRIFSYANAWMVPIVFSFPVFSTFWLNSLRLFPVLW